MASIETDRVLVDEGLRVIQLLPSIVIGDSRAGNNRGDTKVVNAPVNAFGRAKEAMSSLGGEWPERAKAWLVGLIATTFPADRSAELNLVPVDRVAAGILASLGTPEAIGARIHLATDNRIRSEEVVRITREELGVNVRMADPTLTRNLTLPVVKAVLLAMGETKLANVLEKLAPSSGCTGSGGSRSTTWGTTCGSSGCPSAAGHQRRVPHAVPAQRLRPGVRPGARRGRDRPTRAAVGGSIEGIEFDSGRQVASMRASEFRRLLSQRLELRSFQPR